MAARLVGLLASCGNEFRSLLLSADALPKLVDALEAMETLTSAVSQPGATVPVKQHTVCGY